jgi:hypothetical protein
MSNRNFAGMITLSLAMIGFFPVRAAVVYPGNGNGDGGGPIGLGSLELKDDRAIITATLTKGPGPFQGNLVLFIDSTAGGFNTTSLFTDNSTELIRSISGLSESGNARAIANFASGFYADYAIAIGVNPNGQLFRLNQGESGPTIEYVRQINLDPRDHQSFASYTFNFEWTDIGLPTRTPTNFFKFETVYATPYGSFYTESFESLTATGPALWGTLNFSNYDVYGVDPVPEPANTALMTFGGIFAGVGLLSRLRRTLRHETPLSETTSEHE